MKIDIMYKKVHILAETGILAGFDVKKTIFPARNTNIYKICKLRVAILSIFSLGDRFRFSCLD